MTDKGRWQSDLWPSLPLNEWQETYRTLHMWTQAVGKIRLALAAPLNHWWHVTLYVNAQGLTTGPVPFPAGFFEIQFDFQEHQLSICTSPGGKTSRPLRAEPVAVFYRALMDSLAALGIEVAINPKPQEIADAIPLDQDQTHCSYDARRVRDLWQILMSGAKVFEKFRGQYIGKCSPVHFFWGSFDLACSRFSGRRAPPRKGVISGPAYSHEVWSAGFWPGGGAVDSPAYYAYVVPQPAGIEKAEIRPDAAKWNAGMSEFVLLYDDVRQAESPEETLFEFLASTFDAASRLGNWPALT
ncbi:MAG TPA: DUF5996 family protein [Bryobacteraceae bacterium]|jgi:hypothetical protein|nr:DUF5996 family protein [Bryobacteraceae bacterium]